jgi:hypothetical protein
VASAENKLKQRTRIITVSKLPLLCLYARQLQYNAVMMNPGDESY